MSKGQLDRVKVRRMKPGQVNAQVRNHILLWDPANSAGMFIAEGRILEDPFVVDNALVRRFTKPTELPW